MKRGFTILVLFFILAASGVSAHHLWVTRSGEGVRIARGTFPDSFEVYNTSAVKGASAWSSRGQKLALTRVDRKNRVVFRTGTPPAMAIAWAQWGLRVHTTRGKKIMGPVEAKNKGFTVIDSFSSSHFGKSIFEKTPAMYEPTGMRFEIIPLDNPFTLKPNRYTRVKVVFDGEPLKDITLFYGNDERAETGGDGIARVQCTADESTLIWARHRVDEPKGSEKKYSLYMTFLTVGK